MEKHKLLPKIKNITAHNWLINIDSKQTYNLVNDKIRELSSSNTRNIFLAITEPELFIAYFVAAIVVKVELFICNPNWQEYEWEQICRLVNPDLIIAQPKIREQIQTIIDTQTSLNYVKPSNYEHLLKEESLIMIPTGGTSGKICFAMHTWSSLNNSVRGFTQYFQVTQINSYCLLPLYHVSGLMQLIRSLITEGKLVLGTYQQLKQGIKLPVNYDDFFISLVPTQLQLLIDRESEWLAQFKTVLLGGAPATNSLLNKARIAQIPLAPTYGMTETASQIVTLKPQDFLEGNNSSGQVLPHAVVRIIDEAGKCLPTTEMGIIEIESPSLCFGYYPDYFDSPGVFTTDDVGYFDPAGYLHIIGRVSQKIITGGENVFPSEVEAAILATGLVTDICVVGIPDPYWGQAVTAIYIPIKSDIKLTTISQSIQALLSKYKHPQHWIEIASLPRDDRGKINRNQLREYAVSQIARKSQL